MKNASGFLAAIALALLVPLASAAAAPGDRLDRSRLGPAAFHDDFRQGLSLDHGCSSRTAKYVDQYCGQGPTDGPYARTHGEHQCYSDPAFNGINPFSLESGGLLISARAAGGSPKPACGKSKYTSGLISTVNSFRMTHGYWEVVAQMPRGGEARWPAIWLMASGWPPEIDIVEMAKGVLHSTQHSKLHPDGLGSTAPSLGCLCDRPHAFGLLDTGTELVWYVDGVEWYRAPADPGIGEAKYYLIVNLAVTGRPGGWTDAETPTSVPASLRVVSISAYPAVRN